jgi:hypothetical protein
MTQATKRIGTVSQLLFSIRECLTDDLLKPKIRKRYRPVPTTGHCYVATETLYHLLTDKDKKIFKPHYVKIDGDTHWFLMNERRNLMFDPTYDQFPSLPDYGSGKRCGFLTKKPSSRSKILIGRVKRKLRTNNEKRRITRSRTTLQS